MCVFVCLVIKQALFSFPLFNDHSFLKCFEYINDQTDDYHAKCFLFQPSANLSHKKQTIPIIQSIHNKDLCFIIDGNHDRLCS